jgi:hypothetical protein
MATRAIQRDHELRDEALAVPRLLDHPAPYLMQLFAPAAVGVHEIPPVPNMD